MAYEITRIAALAAVAVVSVAGVASASFDSDAPLGTTEVDDGRHMVQTDGQRPARSTWNPIAFTDTVESWTGTASPIASAVPGTSSSRVGSEIDRAVARHEVLVATSDVAVLPSALDARAYAEALERHLGHR